MKQKAEAGAVRVKVLRLPHAVGLPLPEYQSQEAAGMDLIAALEEGRPLRLAPGSRALVPTGLILELPAGTEAQVRPRSGLALRHGVTVLNSPGTIDSDYRGELKVLLANFGEAAFEIERGERIAQLVMARVARARLVEHRAVAGTKRGDGGFGSTGSQTSAKKSRQASHRPVRAKSKPSRKA